MKRMLLWLCFVAALSVSATAALPDLGNARLVVLANNLQNYYYNYNTGRGDYTDSERAAKTNKIVSAMLEANADIYAFCEVEAKPIVLQNLAEQMNEECGVEGRYATVNDGINEDWDAEYNNNLKSGFIYRTDKVEPYGDNYATTNVTYYKNTMRIQAWTELATEERFTISMNHFKAGQNDSDKEKRVSNATWLLAGLSSSYKVKDPDILILGDLNCQVDEQALQYIINAGYEEQLLRFDEDSYSYIYYGNHELIDHALANSSMADQITGAAVWHSNTSVNYNSRYSDHDAVMVGVFEKSSDDVESITITLPAKKILHNGQLIIERGGMQYTITGQRL